MLKRTYVTLNAISVRKPFHESWSDESGPDQMQLQRQARRRRIEAKQVMPGYKIKAEGTIILMQYGVC